jgi:hypothetical protein
MCEYRHVINNEKARKSVMQYYSSKADGRSAIQETTLIELDKNLEGT